MQFGVNNTPEYKAMNPNGLVPTIDEDGFILWESHAIVRYFSRKHGSGTLFPHDARVAADADRWMEWSSTTMWLNLRPVFWNLIRTPPEKRNMGEVADCTAKLGANLAMVDAQLAKRAHIAGESFSMGDIPLGVAAYRWFNMPIERIALPHFERWYRAICERPAFKQHCMLPLT
jgi:glutathione S-transferase